MQKQNLCDLENYVQVYKLAKIIYLVFFKFLSQKTYAKILEPQINFISW